MIHERGNLSERIVSFCQFTRNNGLSNGIEETITSLEACSLGAIKNEKTIRNVLKTILCSSKEEVLKFDGLFDLYWKNKSIPKRKNPKGTTNYSQGNQIRKNIVYYYSEIENIEAKGEEKQITGASPSEQLKKMDFSKIDEKNMTEFDKITNRLWNSMSFRLSNKLKHVNHRDRKMDFRRTIRYNLSRGTDPVYLKFKGKQKIKANMVILLDISGSMKEYCNFYLHFIYSLHKYFKNLSTFTFSTRLNNITKLMQRKELSYILEKLKDEELAWLSGTKISDCLHKFNEHFAKNVTSRHTIVMVISDGLDTGDPNSLYSELSSIKQRVKKIIWINPLKGMENYEPLTRGMNKILPLLDGFISGHNLNSLQEIEDLIDGKI